MVRRLAEQLKARPRKERRPATTVDSLKGLYVVDNFSGATRECVWECRNGSLVQARAQRSAGSFVPAEILAVLARVAHFFEDAQARQVEHCSQLRVQDVLDGAPSASERHLSLRRKG